MIDYDEYIRICKNGAICILSSFTFCISLFAQDLQGPHAPGSLRMATNYDVGVSASDGITIYANPEFRWTKPPDVGTCGTGDYYQYAVTDSNNDPWSGPLLRQGFTTTTNIRPGAMSLGSFKFWVQAQDSCGNWGEWGSTNYTVDWTPPTAPTTLINPADPTFDTKPNVTWIGDSDSVSGVGTYDVEFTGVTTYTFHSGDRTLDDIDFGGIGLSDGLWSWRVKVADVAGNYSWSDTQVITVNTLPVIMTDIEYQIMDGFGISGAWSANHLYDESKINPSVRTDVIAKLFNVDSGAGISILRNRIIPSNFGINEQINLMADAKLHGVRRFVSVPWTPPASMTKLWPDGDLHLDMDKKLDYAIYFTEHLQRTDDIGIRLSFVGVQNEPSWHPQPEYDYCIWTDDEMIEFTSVLRNTLNSRGFADVGIFSPDDFSWESSLGRVNYLVTERADSNIDVFTTHAYGGSDEDRVSLSALAAQRNKPLWQTEIFDPAIYLDSNGVEPVSSSGIESGIRWALNIWNDLHLANVSGWCYWWIYDRANRSPSGVGLISRDWNNHIRYPKRYYTFSQFSRFIRPESQRIGVAISNPGYKMVAFKDYANQQIVVVAINDRSTHQDVIFDLSAYANSGNVRTFRTSATEDIAPLPEESYTDSLYACSLSPMSVTTMIFPVGLSTPLPRQFTLLWPPDGESNWATSGTLNWGAARFASTYDVFMDQGNPPATLVSSNQTDLYFDYPNLDYSKTYYWQVIAKNSAATTTAVGGPWNFTTTMQAPTLVGPPDGSPDQPTVVTFSWNSVYGAETYGLQVSQDTGFSTVVFDQDKIPDTSQSVGGLAANATYYWRVNAENPGGVSQFSDRSGFSRDATAIAIPGTFSLLTPVDGDSNMPASAVLSWQLSSNATGYDVYLDTITPPSVVVATNQGWTHYTYNDLIHGAVYHWQVVAKNASGSEVAGGSPWSFTVYTYKSFGFDKPAGWQLISIPLSISGTDIDSLLPEEVEMVYQYHQQYELVDVLENGLGYWIKCPVNLKWTIEGQPCVSDTIDLFQGWNIIGALDVALPVSNVTSIPGGVVTTNFFKYDTSYSTSDSLSPGWGYWVKVSQNCKIILNPAGPNSAMAKNTIKILPAEELPPSPPGDQTVLRLIIPTHYVLDQNHPNPFNPVTVIQYSIPRTTTVNLRIYNVLGEEITTLVNEKQSPGRYQAEWKADGVANGIYFYRITAGDFMETKKMVLMK